jgi:hypothetical protein
MTVPMKKTKLVEVTFWDCGVADHNHKSKGGCISCIERQPKTRRPNTKERDVEVFLHALRGCRSKDIVAKFELSSSQRVLTITTAYARQLWYAHLDSKGVCSKYDPRGLTIKDFHRDREKWLELHNKYFLKSK